MSWLNLRLTPEDIPDYWDNGQNIGLLCGELSGWRVDVDLDVPEGVSIAGRFLVPTLTSGRRNKPHSHWWYLAPGAKTTKFKDVDGTMLLELRSTGCQTLVEPSRHPSGDKYIWHRESGFKPVEMDAAELGVTLSEAGNSDARSPSPASDKGRDDRRRRRPARRPYGSVWIPVTTGAPG